MLNVMECALCQTLNPRKSFNPILLLRVYSYFNDFLRLTKR